MKKFFPLPDSNARPLVHSAMFSNCSNHGAIELDDKVKIVKVYEFHQKVSIRLLIILHCSDPLKYPNYFANRQFNDLKVDQ